MDADDFATLPHDEHFCRICDTFCGWCDFCHEAHCMNGHTHNGPWEGKGRTLEEMGLA